MNIAQIIITVAAIWGAGLSTYTLINNRTKDKPKIKAKLTFGFLTSGPQLSSQMLFLEAANIGNRIVTLSSCGLRLPPRGKRVMIFVKPGGGEELPCEVAPGKNLTVWVEESEIAQDLKSNGFNNTVKISGFYKDAIGNSYTSKSVKFPIN